MKYINNLLKNIYDGTFIGFIAMAIIAFLIMLGSVFAIKSLSNYNGRICNYSGKFWIDDSKDRTREGDLKGCFSWEEMIEMDRL